MKNLNVLLIFFIFFCFLLVSNVYSSKIQYNEKMCIYKTGSSSLYISFDTIYLNESKLNSTGQIITYVNTTNYLNITNNITQNTTYDATELITNITALLNNNTRQDTNLTAIWGNFSLYATIISLQNSMSGNVSTSNLQTLGFNTTTQLNNLYATSSQTTALLNNNTRQDTNLTAIWGNFSLYSITSIDIISDLANISKYMTNFSPILASVVNETTLIIPINNAINKSKACSPPGNLTYNTTHMFLCVSTTWKVAAIS